MLLRDALRTQSPSLALQRAAADEIARLDALVDRYHNCVLELENARTKVLATQASSDPASASQAGCPSLVRPGSTTAEGPADQGPAVGQAMTNSPFQET